MKKNSSLERFLVGKDDICHLRKAENRSKVL